MKCNWSDNFATLLEKTGSQFSNEVVVQVVISQNDNTCTYVDTPHIALFEASVKLLEM